MRILKIIGMIAGGLVALFLIVAAVLPSSYRITRTVEIETPAEMIYPLVVNLPNWPKWDPFTEQEPTAKSTFVGEPGTIGSEWSWVGEVIGTGSMTVEEVVPNRYIRSRMEMIAPQPMVAQDLWDFTPTASGTKVTWTVQGDLDYPMGRIFGLFMESLMGSTFEKGLANLKRLSEQQTVAPLSSNDSR